MNAAQRAAALEQVPVSMRENIKGFATDLAGYTVAFTKKPVATDNEFWNTSEQYHVVSYDPKGCPNWLDSWVPINGNESGDISPRTALTFVAAVFALALVLVLSVWLTRSPELAKPNEGNAGQQQQAG